MAWRDSLSRCVSAWMAFSCAVGSASATAQTAPASAPLQTGAADESQPALSLELAQSVPAAIELEIPNVGTVSAPLQILILLTFLTFIPAVLVTADTTPELLLEARQNGHPLLYKPVRPAKLRALLSQLLAKHSTGRTQSSPRWDTG